MRVIFNASNVVKGGGIQAAVNFVIQSYNSTNDMIEWYYILSPQVNYEIESQGILLENTLLVQSSPASDFNVRRLILRYEVEVSPHVVFSIFGPTYVDFKSKHISGFANGWVTHSTLSTFFNTYGFKLHKSLKAVFKYIYYAYYIRKADEWVFETETARNGFVNRLKVDPKKTHVVPNSCFDIKNDFISSDVIIVNDVTLRKDDNLILCLSADYPHKNIKNIIFAMSYLVNVLDCTNFKLVLTLDSTSIDKYKDIIHSKNLNDYIVNLDKVNVCDLERLYSVTSFTILMSYIETYSAVYPESFITGTPVLTSDLPFARDACGNAAIFANPKSHKEIALAVKRLLDDQQLKSELISSGYILAKKQITSLQKYNRILDIIGKV